MGFEGLLGNLNMQAILRGYLEYKKIPSSMLFYGPPSARVLDFSTAFSKALNCLEKQNDFCDTCENCIEINKGIYPDLSVLFPDGQNYKKEQINAIIQDNIRKPIKSDYKIYIIQKAHKMQASSANALLKALEEPSESTIFILLSNNINGFLPTIKSRCQILSFKSLSVKELTGYFVNQGCRKDEAVIMANLSISERNQIFDLSFNKINKKRIEAINLLEEMILNRIEENVMLKLNDLSRNRKGFLKYLEETVNLISLLLRDIMVLKIDRLTEYLINLDFKERLKNIADQLSIEKIFYLIKKMEVILRDIERNLNSKTLIIEFIRSFVEKGAISG
jgi:DNA polymerase-3 subunit delta'